MQSFVQFIHELRRRGVADFPQSRYNVVRPSAKKSPSQTNKPFPRVGFHSSPITRGNGYQVGVPWVLDDVARIDRKSTRLNSSHGYISYAVFCLKKKKTYLQDVLLQQSHPPALLQRPAPENPCAH